MAVSDLFFRIDLPYGEYAWSAKPENRNYRSGPDAVARVRVWQDNHPQYRERQEAKRAIALQDHCDAQVLELKEETLIAPNSDKIAEPALQDFIHTQPLVFIGLIAHFFNISLQDDMAHTTRRLQQLGEDIANGREPGECVQTGDLFRMFAPGAGAVQLGGSALSPGFDTFRYWKTQCQYFWVRERWLLRLRAQA